MTDKYITYNSNDIYFDDIGSELFKLAVSFSFSINSKRKLAFVEGSYTNILNIFIKSINYKSLTLEDYQNLNFKDYKYNNYTDNDNLNFIFNDEINFNHKFINPDVRNLLSILIVNNSVYSKLVHTKINNIMNYFADYEIDNYVCVNIKKDLFIPFYYEKAYHHFFTNKKIIILTDDIEWTQMNFNFVSKYNVIYIDNNKDNRFINFVLLSSFNNMIIDKNNFSWWCAYLGNKNKKVVVPNNHHHFYLDNWIRQS
jgi:hypothetical protein